MSSDRSSSAKMKAGAPARRDSGVTTRGITFAEALVAVRRRGSGGEGPATDDELHRVSALMQSAGLAPHVTRHVDVEYACERLADSPEIDADELAELLGKA